MTAANFRAARQTLNLTFGELAGELNASEREVRAWEAGTARIPRRQARNMAFLVAVVTQEATLDAAGLPRCEWIAAYDAEPIPSEVDDRMARFDRAQAHSAACPVCKARERYAEEHLPPLPTPSIPPVGTFFDLGVRTLDWIPPWLWPAAAGAAIILAMTVIRMLGHLPRLFRHPEEIWMMLATLAAAGGAGAAGGLVYSAVWPAFRRLGRMGDYLTGVVCMTAYMGGVALVAPYAFGEPVVQDGRGWLIFLLCAVGFGLLIGHTWFRSPQPPAAQ